MSAYSDLIDTLLAKRGLKTDEEREQFLNPDYERDTHDPFLLKDMNKAVKRILKALDEDEYIAIYSDFDADGIPGGVLLHDFFKKIGYENFTNYIPHRDNEGYGFHKGAIDTLAQKGCSLIITVDVGIGNVETVAHAKELGVDVIVTDHHLAGETMPKALAIVNPNQSSDTYPCKDLCGAGVAFKLVQALITKGRFEEKKWAESIKDGWEKWLLDLVAIATIADMVSVTGENRTLTSFGLFVLRKSRRPGIAALCRKLRIRQHLLTEDDIGFSVAPRINAASRLGDPYIAFSLLATTDFAEAAHAATELEKLNRQRKTKVATYVRAAKKKVKENGGGSVVVLGSASWNPSMLGLVASSLVEHVQKPVCLWGRDGTGALKGSCRSDGTVNIFDMLTEASEILTHHGGHTHAGGFSVAVDNVHALSENFSRAYNTHAKNMSEKDLKTDATLVLKDADEVIQLLEKLSPFGVGNPKPIFACDNVTCLNVRSFGQNDAHVEVELQQDVGSALRGIAFFKDPKNFTRTPKVGDSACVYGSLERSQFGGVSRLELRIVDIT